MTLLTSQLAKLNSEQKKAVYTTEGRVLVLAGAGSGKTRVLTSRIAYLIQEKQIPEDQILGLTFTNKAAREMRERLSSLVGEASAKKVFLSTFHSFCMALLRKEIEALGYTRHFSLYSEREVKRLITNLARQMLAHEGELPSIETTYEALQTSRARGSFEKDKKEDFLYELQEKLTISLRAYNAVDFEMLLLLVVQLFEKHPQIMKKYQQQYRYILIDEYQDTNTIQHTLCEYLSSIHHNLFVVGDDDQAIYGWRGASMDNILHFKADTVIKLEQNYRSTPTILSASNALILHNKERHPKMLWSQLPEGDKISIFHAPNDQEEAQAIAKRIVHLRESYHLKWKDIAILYRSNILSKPLEIALMNTLWKKDQTWMRGIPYAVYGGVELYERSEVKDILAYLRFFSNPLDQEACLRIINLPRRGISEQSLDILTAYNRKNHLSLWQVLEDIKDKKEGISELISSLSSKALSGIQIFVDLIKTARAKLSQKVPLHSILSWLIETINYQKTIQEEVKSESMQATKWENVTSCIELLKTYEEENKDHASLEDFLSNLSLDSGQDKFKRKEEKEDKVSLMTFHSAKGLEFTACFLMGLEDHVLPHEKSLQDRSLEEERRLFYVALTRSKKLLTLSMAKNRKKHGKEVESKPSRFLFELPKEVLRVTSHLNLD